MADPTQKPSPPPKQPKAPISGTFGASGAHPGAPARESRPDRAWPIPAERVTRESLLPRPSHLPPPEWTLDAALHAAAELAADLRERSTEAELARTFVEAVQQVVPGLEVTVRFFVERTVAWFVSSAPLSDRGGASSDAVHVSRVAMTRARRLGSGAEGALTPPTPELVVVDHAEPITAEGRGAVDALATDGELVLAITTLEAKDPTRVGPLEPLFALFTDELAVAIARLRSSHQEDFLRSYLEEMFEHARGPIIAIAADRTVRAVNRPALDLIEVPREEVIGQDLLKLLRAEAHRERVARTFAAALTHPAMMSLELRVLKRDGSAVRTRWNVATILDTDGTVGAVVAMGEDLSDVQRLEQQVLHAEKLATLGQIAAGVLHELNNPLTSITVYSDYLLSKAKRTQGPQEDTDRLARIAESAARMTRFTRDLVTYARPNTEPPAEVSVVEVIEQSIRFCEHVLDEAGILVERAYAEALPPIDAVRGQLHQIFVNLLTNAAQALAEMRAGEGVRPRLTLSAALEGPNIVVRIEDNGPGIPADRLARIFEPFFTTKGAGKGTGLGLSIVRNLVEQHHGTITVTSRTAAHAPSAGRDEELGSGTCFELRFPALSGTATPRPTERTPP